MDFRRAVQVCGALGIAALALAAPARGESVPRITTGPTIIGTAQVGAVLTATATWQGTPTPTPVWAWLRCERASALCNPIAGATSTSYRIAASDAGKVLRVHLRVTNADGDDEKRSAATAVVAPAPTPTPTVSPVPAATPRPTPSATPTATPTSTATPTVLPQTTVVTASASPVPTPAATAAPAKTPAPPRLLRPFPVVRIKGVLTAEGARVTLLSVRAPRRSRVTVVCRGKDCPARRYTSPKPSGRLRPFERALRAGTRIEVRVTRAGFVGKSTVFVIRRQSAPRRTDRCLPPGAERAVRCPGS